MYDGWHYISAPRCSKFQLRTATSLQLDNSMHRRYFCTLPLSQGITFNWPLSTAMHVFYDPLDSGRLRNMFLFRVSFFSVDLGRLNRYTRPLTYWSTSGGCGRAYDGDYSISFVIIDQLAINCNFTPHASIVYYTLCLLASAIDSAALIVVSILSLCINFHRYRCLIFY